MNKKIIKNCLLCFAIALSCLLSCFISTPIYNVYASNIGIDYLSKYTDVLDDLQKDSNFNKDNYPEVATDYSLQVLNLSESNESELFVYVYQPSGNEKNLVASTINIATTFGENYNFVNYKLTLVSSNDVFYKYVVNNYIISTSTIREYEITSIYRVFDEEIDNSIDDDNGNTIDEVNYKVAKHWTFTADDIICQDIETIEIMSKFVGFVRYGDGDWWHLWGESACDRHFVAFSTDKRIDRLMEADIFYQKQSAHFKNYYSWMYVDNWSFGNVIDSYSYLDYTQRGNYDNGHYNYTWDRIQNVNDFISSVNITNTYSCGILDVENESKITDDNVDELRQQEWVLSFLETDYELTRSGEEDNYYSTRVGNVSILRLKFETDGIIYNLGVIDNKQSGSDVPINTFNTTMELNDMFKIILGILLLIVLIVLLAPILPTILSFLWWFIKLLFKIVILIISLPIKIIQFIFNKKE